MAWIRVNIDKETKVAASAIFEPLGMDLSTAIKAFLEKAIAEGGMPFAIELDETTRQAMQAAQSMRETSEKNGNSTMTLDEINEEIAKARKERK